MPPPPPSSMKMLPSGSPSSSLLPVVVVVVVVVLIAVVASDADVLVEADVPLAPAALTGGARSGQPAMITSDPPMSQPSPWVFMPRS
jgi:hypothetical protein